jgi:hypothetical protein
VFITQLKNAHTASTKKTKVRGEENHEKKERVMRVQVHVDLHYGLEEGYFRTKPRIVSKRLIKKERRFILSALF